LGQRLDSGAPCGGRRASGTPEKIEAAQRFRATGQPADDPRYERGASHRQRAERRPTRQRLAWRACSDYAAGIRMFYTEIPFRVEELLKVEN